MTSFEKRPTQELVVRDEFSSGKRPSTMLSNDEESATISRAKLLRKIDLVLLPMMLLTYGLQYLDKAVLGFAAVYTLDKDNHLVGQDYSWVNSIFYFGYLGFEYPLLSLLPRFPVEKYLGFMVSVWGFTLMMNNFSNSYAGLLVVRFIMGALESVVAPCFVIIVARWYQREEQPIRQVVWFAGTPLFAIFGGLIGYAMGHIEDPSIATWRIMFLIFGGITFIWGIIIFFWFPADPSTAWCLSEEERVAASAATTTQGTGPMRNWKWSQAKEAFLDLKTYIFLVIGFLNTIPSGALSGFSSLIIKNLGFSAVNTLAIGIPGNIVQLVSLLLGGFICTKIPNMRLYAMSACCIPSIIGTALLHSLPSSNKWGCVVSLWIIYTNSVSLAVSFSVIGGNVAGVAKKATVTFLLFLGYCAGSIASPQFFMTSQAKEGYPSGVEAMLICFCLLVIFPLALRALYVYENRKRDQAAANGDIQPAAAEFEDATDCEMRAFRYVL